MKRLLAILGVFALLGTLFVIASAGPASAASAAIQITNDGDATDNPILATATPVSGCGQAVASVQVNIGGTKDLSLNLACASWDVVITDATGECTVDNDGGTVNNNTDSWTPSSFTSETQNGTGYCVFNMTITTEKDVDHPLDIHAAEQSSYIMAIAGNVDGVGEGTTPQSASCLPEEIIYSQNGGSANTVTTKVPATVVYKGAIATCYYIVIEGLAPDGQECVDVGGDIYSEIYPPTLPQGECAGLTSGDFADDAHITFYNAFDHVPMTVTKTFTGREYYTTVDRGDFHIYTPGLCGALPVDPFGGLLGNVGIYRTINASQAPQVVAWLPDILKAGAHGPCTYRVQENNAPDGCVAVAPTGSDADGPYWDATWEPGMTAMTINIVNDCAEVVPEPEPEPSVAPTTAPKKPGAPGAKKPSGGGSAAPKFTG